MGLRYGLRTARDLFGKLDRDAALLEDEVTSDRMFNFVVTARHLPEWIEKDPTAPPESKSALSAVRDTDVYRTCRDIADASKHFELTAKRSVESNVGEVSSDQGYGVGRYGKGGYGVGEESITVLLASGERTDALAFSRLILDLYRPLFKSAV